MGVAEKIGAILSESERLRHSIARELASLPTAPRSGSPAAIPRRPADHAHTATPRPHEPIPRRPA